MNVTLSVKVPEELKEKLKRFNVNWSEEVRRFLEERLRQLEALNAIEEASKKAETVGLGWTALG